MLRIQAGIEDGMYIPDLLGLAFILEMGPGANWRHVEITEGVSSACEDVSCFKCREHTLAEGYGRGSGEHLGETLYSSDSLHLKNA